MTSGVPLTDPGGGGTLLMAVTWIRAVITGTPATIVATIAIAALGMLMMQGRVPLRRGTTVVFGCFVIFGAGVMVDGLMRIAAASNAEGMHEQRVEGANPPVITAPPQPQVYDPYAGASVPIVQTSDSHMN